MWLRRALRITMVTAAMGAASLAVAAPASAAPAAPAVLAPATDPHPADAAADLEGGRTTLVLDAGTAGVLTDNGVSVSPTGDAHPSGGGISFPITGGEVVPSTLAGTIEHSGGLEFRAGGTTLGVQDFVIDTVAGVLTARVSGTDTRVPLLNLSLADASIKTQDNGFTVDGVRGTLTAEAAAALNATFGVDLFSAGLPVGTADVEACI
ncbi:MAG TPA: HtaA domain-containing protein [Pseudonocardia sp.]|nr:HtaA domain-containing protein [Pseudonocardia sp.]